VALNLFYISYIPEATAIFQMVWNLVQRMLRFFDHIFVQDENSLTWMADISMEHVRIAGDTRFDRVAQIAAEAKEI
jgi:3-deoxy-D-manno-octulosonic-acid transferase